MKETNWNSIRDKFFKECAVEQSVHSYFILNPENLFEWFKKELEAVNVLRWVKASEAPFDTWVLLGNEHWIGVAKRRKPEDEYEPEWHDEMMQYLEVDKSYYFMPLPPKPAKGNVEEEVSRENKRP